MPDNPTYLHRLDRILAEARTPKPIPFFRRRDIQALFGLQKRQAVNLMHRIGAVRVSRELALGLLTVAFANEQQLLERLFLLARRLAAQPQLLSSASSLLR